MIPSFHGFVDEKKMIRLTAVVLIEHFVVLENPTTTLDVGIVGGSLAFLQMNRLLKVYSYEQVIGFDFCVNASEGDVLV